MSHSKDPFAYEIHFWELSRKLAAREHGNDHEILRLDFAKVSQAVWFQNKFYAFLRAREWAARARKVEDWVIEDWNSETRACKAFQITRDGTQLIWIRKTKKDVFRGVLEEIDRQLPDKEVSSNPRLEPRDSQRPEGPAYEFNADDLPSEE